MSQSPVSVPQAGKDGPRLWQCGRCRLWFDADPGAHATAHLEWWLCPPCRVILLGAPRRPATTITSVVAP